MSVPVYVITGFLESGKTTLLNQLLEQQDTPRPQRLVVQFETGIEELSPDLDCDLMVVPKRILEQEPKKVVHQLQQYLQNTTVDEIWVEWNGITPITELYSILLHRDLNGLCRVKKILHMADAQTLEQLLGKTGGALPEQIAECDMVIARGFFSQDEFRRLRRLLRGINPGVPLFEADTPATIWAAAQRSKHNPISVLAGGVFLTAAAFLVAERVFSLSSGPLNTILTVFLGIVLQAIPFLLLGVLISSVIQVLIPRRAIERYFPKSLAGGMLAAVLAGFCLPVCDCASIPIFHGLVKKGVPLPAAVTFMTATPVINPIVMLSTYHAFNGDWSVVLARVGLGIASAVLIGLWFALRPAKTNVVRGGGFGGLLCSCGCYGEPEDITAPTEKLLLILRHSQAEFFNVAKYLTVGAFLASVFQIVANSAFRIEGGTDFALSLVLMMVLAFVLSLCSSSDAMVARGFASQFPMGALMGFLVFGPMMDIKNVLLLSGGFQKRFVARLLAVCFVVCFITVWLWARVMTGG